jgi:hypothetical protein
VDLNGTPYQICSWSCYSYYKPYVQLDEATLVIVGNFPVAVEASSWGSIKSLFR